MVQSTRWGIRAKLLQKVVYGNAQSSKVALSEGPDYWKPTRLLGPNVFQK
jgi:hypothetical protein